MREIGADRLALTAASVTMLVGSLLALGQDNLKARLQKKCLGFGAYLLRLTKGGLGWRRPQTRPAQAPIAALPPP